MSTRCQILVEGTDVVLYRHGDGYPDGPNGVIAALKPIVTNFIKWRGFDECYLPAHIISGLIVAHTKWCDKVIRACKRKGQKPREYSAYESAKYLGHGIDGYNPDAGNTGLHGDIEFLYVVKKNGTIEVRECFIDPDGPCNIDNTKLKKTVRYGKK